MRATGAGIWSSQFVMPWEWRRGVLVIQQYDANPHAEGSYIKSNIDRDDEATDHVPGGRWCDRLPTSNEA